MRNSLKCFLSCILPCGSLDVVRIVHCSGHLEEVTGTVLAGDVMKANPKHVLRKHCPERVRTIVLPPDAPLKRGHIYFFCPVPFNSSFSSSSPSAKIDEAPTEKNPRRDFHREPPSDQKYPTDDDESMVPPPFKGRRITEVVDSDRKCTVSQEGEWGSGALISGAYRRIYLIAHNILIDFLL